MAKKKKFKLVDAILATVCITLVAESVAPTAAIGNTQYFWWIFLILGIVGIVGSLFITDILISSLLGVFSFSSFWTIKEVFDQRKRVLKGWFPMNPKRKHEYE